MATTTGSAGNDSWTIVQAGTYTIDGAGGVDTLSMGTSKLSDYVLGKLSDGWITVDTVSGASATLRVKLLNVEKLLFNSGKTSVDLATYFGDSIAPTLLSSSPAHGASNVSLNANLVFNFSETIQLGTASISLQTASGQVLETFGAGSSGLSISGSSLTIHPAANLALDSSYQIVFASNALRDSAGNPYAGGSASFTTIAVNHAPTGSVSIAGSALTGQILTLQNTLADADGLGQFSYQWLANGVAIQGATASSLTLGAAQAGSAIAVQLAYTDGTGSNERVSSAATPRVGGLYAGSASNDKLSGSAGNDQLDGAGGVDTVVVQGKRANFFLATSATGYTLSDQSGAEGMDSLLNVERIAFADATLALDIAGNGGQSYRLYQAAFNRVPDSGGLGFWIHHMDTGMPLETVASYFVSSQEFIDLYGRNLSNAAFIDKLYQNVLHRAGDAGGVEFWNNYMDKLGGSQASVLAYFGESPENVAALAVTIGQGFTYTPYG